MAKRAAAVNPAPVPLTSYKRHILHIITEHGRHLEFKIKCAIRFFKKHTFVRRYVAQAAFAEKTGAVKTQTVSTDRGMFKELSILQSGSTVFNTSDVIRNEKQIEFVV